MVTPTDLSLNLFSLLQNQAGLDPAVYLAPEQPLIHATKISQDDIEMQEARVVALRKKLAQELSAISS